MEVCSMPRPERPLIMIGRRKNGTVTEIHVQTLASLSRSVTVSRDMKTRNALKPFNQAVNFHWHEINQLHVIGLSMHGYLGDS